MQNKIQFSFNWNNKLDCNCFTTIRITQPEKYIINNIYEIWLKKQIICEASIKEIKNFYLKDLNNFIAFLDTGYNKEECTDIIKKMYKNVNFQQKTLSLILIVKSEKCKK